MDRYGGGGYGGSDRYGDRGDRYGGSRYGGGDRYGGRDDYDRRDRYDDRRYEYDRLIRTSLLGPIARHLLILLTWPWGLFNRAPFQISFVPNPPPYLSSLFQT